MKLGNKTLRLSTSWSCSSCSKSCLQTRNSLLLLHHFAASLFSQDQCSRRSPLSSQKSSCVQPANLPSQASYYYSSARTVNPETQLFWSLVSPITSSISLQSFAIYSTNSTWLFMDALADVSVQPRLEQFGKAVSNKDQGLWLQTRIHARDQRAAQYECLAFQRKLKHQTGTRRDAIVNWTIPSCPGCPTTTPEAILRQHIARIPRVHEKHGE